MSKHCHCHQLLDLIMASKRKKQTAGVKYASCLTLIFIRSLCNTKYSCLSAVFENH